MRRHLHSRQEFEIEYYTCFLVDMYIGIIIMFFFICSQSGRVWLL